MSISRFAWFRGQPVAVVGGCADPHWVAANSHREERELMHVRTRVVGLIATAVAMSCAMVAAAPAQAITPTGEFAPYTACPVDNSAFVESGDGNCVWSQTTGGQVTIGTKTVPVVNPITLQGGFTGASPNLIWFNASPASQTLVDPGQPVPGGLNGNPDDTSPGNSVTAQTELV